MTGRARHHHWLFLAAGAVLFGLLLRGFGVGPLVHSLQAQGPRLLLILVPSAFSYVLFGLSWWLVLDREARREVSFGYLYLVSLAGIALNYLSPILALGGEPLKMFLLSRKLGRHRAVSSVVTYDVVHVLSHVFVFLLAFVAGFWILAHSVAREIALSAGVIACAVAAAVILGCQERGVGARVLDLLGTVPGLRHRRALLDGWKDRLGRYDDSVTALYRTRRGTFWTALLLDFAGRAFLSVEVLFMLSNVGRWLGPLRSFFVYGMSTLVAAVTFFVPYQLGVKEGGFYLCLQWLHVNPSLGVYMGVVSRLRELLWIATGLLMLLALGARRPGPARKEIR